MTPRRLLKVGPLDLHGDGPAALAGLVAPGPDAIRHRQDGNLDPGRIDQVRLERRLRARRLARPIGIDRPIVLAAGDGVVPAARLAEAPLQVLQRPALQIGAVLDACGVHPGGRRRTDAMELRDRQSFDERWTLFRRDGELSIRLALT